ncbi:ribosome modulation factor [Carbonactinospora thermoautotrophica]|uniref:ribosome modulation factor n=1 Tax=Carbonactinospora thermoautotrophica TaxID=1469144 RepID=UPI000B01A308
MPAPTSSSRPTRGLRGTLVRVARAGWTAGVAGEPLSACPYGDDRPLSRRAWLAGYAGGRRQAGLPTPSTGTVQSPMLNQSR